MTFWSSGGSQPPHYVSRDDVSRSPMLQLAKQATQEGTAAARLPVGARARRSAFRLHIGDFKCDFQVRIGDSHFAHTLIRTSGREVRKCEVRLRNCTSRMRSEIDLGSLGKSRCDQQIIQALTPRVEWLTKSHRTAPLAQNVCRLGQVPPSERPS